MTVFFLLILKVLLLPVLIKVQNLAENALVPAENLHGRGVPAVGNVFSSYRAASDHECDKVWTGVSILLASQHDGRIRSGMVADSYCRDVYYRLDLSVAT